MNHVPLRTRGLQVLYKHNARSGSYDVVYVGMTRGENTGIGGRLLTHPRNKGGLWTHFSAFEVWDNIRPEEVEELEGLFRHLYRKGSKANSLNKQRSYKPLNQIRRQSGKGWVE
jgi:hypothetical protein